VVKVLVDDAVPGGVGKMNDADEVADWATLVTAEVMKVRSVETVCMGEEVEPDEVVAGPEFAVFASVGVVSCADPDETVSLPAGTVLCCGLFTVIDNPVVCPVGPAKTVSEAATVLPPELVVDVVSPVRPVEAVPEGTILPCDPVFVEAVEAVPEARVLLVPKLMAEVCSVGPAVPEAALLPAEPVVDNPVVCPVGPAVEGPATMQYRHWGCWLTYQWSVRLARLKWCRTLECCRLTRWLKYQWYGRLVQLMQFHKLKYCQLNWLVKCSWSAELFWTKAFEKIRYWEEN
jgi:hypothetical protein